VHELEENEEDLVVEIENLAKERHSLELKYHGKCQENETLQLTITEETQRHENTYAENCILLRKLDSKQKKNIKLTE
jgi:hypothetical protein